MRRTLIALAALLVFLPLHSARLEAQHTSCIQCGGPPDDVPPTVTLDGPASPVYDQYPTITIRWCDAVSLHSTTRHIEINGVNVTSSFDFTTGGSGCAVLAHSSSSSVALNNGSNTLYAYIFDMAGNMGEGTFSIYRSQGPPPTVSLAPYKLAPHGLCALCYGVLRWYLRAGDRALLSRWTSPRNVTLTYNGDLYDPRPIVAVDVTHAGDGSNVPDYFTLRMTKSGGGSITFVNGQTELHFAAAATNTYRLEGSSTPPQTAWEPPGSMASP